MPKPPAKRSITTCATCGELTIPASTPSGVPVVVDYRTSPLGGIALSPGGKPTARVIGPQAECPPGHSRHTVHEVTCTRPAKPRRNLPIKRLPKVPVDHPELFDSRPYQRDR